MQSPFPGMDPFLENEEWEDFHTRFNTAISESLSMQVEPRYVVRIERRVYVEHTSDEIGGVRRADVAILASGSAGGSLETSPGVAATAIAPVECILPVPEEIRETYLVIRERESAEVVTVIETLSPGNKRSGGDGRREYLRKRDELLRSQVHLVELDLLRGGDRLPTVNRLPSGDFHAIVSRRQSRPRAQAYVWTIRDPLPTIQIPLKEGDSEVPLDLQSVFATVYSRARYDLSIDYRRPLVPLLSAADNEWFQALTRQA